MKQVFITLLNSMENTTMVQMASINFCLELQMLHLKGLRDIGALRYPFIPWPNQAFAS
jgi:hypothetical protein